MNFKTPEMPFVSIIIPMLNAESTLEKCLMSIGELDYPHDRFETILVDNGSSDNSMAIGKLYGVRVLEEPLGRVGGVRNYGARSARGDVFAFTDSDCILPPEWLSKGVQLLLEEVNVGAVGGGCIVPKDATWVERAWAPILRPNFTRLVKSLPACNFILSRKLFEELDGFDDALVASEDDDLAFRIQQKGLILLACGALFVIHLGYPQTLWKVTKRQIWHGKAARAAAKSNLSRILLMTYFFLVSCFFLPITCLLLFRGSYYYLAINLLFLLFPPILHASFHSYRIRKWRMLFYPLEIIQRFAIYLAFYLGRSIGLLLSYI